jgi:hypothetical protein
MSPGVRFKTGWRRCVDLAVAWRSFPFAVDRHSNRLGQDGCGRASGTFAVKVKEPFFQTGESFFVRIAMLRKQLSWLQLISLFLFICGVVAMEAQQKHVEPAPDARCWRVLDPHREVFNVPAPRDSAAAGPRRGEAEITP